jgi:TPP-dependent pyruvate/acetoin dehydrogenase alpha subunit
VAADLLDLYRRMCLVRAFEERVGRLFRDAEIPGFIHTSVGQEAVAVGVCSALEADDYVVTTHRGHGHVLARGLDVDAAMAELFGKAAGPCKGKGGSMHIADARLGIIGANAIVGASVPLAVGAALASKTLGERRVAVAFFGEGAVAQGGFHEAVNLAAVWELPLLLVCENNVYAEFTDSREMTRRESLVGAVRAAYGIAGVEVDGNDVEAVQAAAAAARAAGGPRLVEALTYRWQGHYEGDAQPYKPADEAAAWKARDPLLVARARLEERGLASPRELDAALTAAHERVDAAEVFAREAPYPELVEVYADVYGV